MIETVTFIGSKHLGIKALKTIHALAPKKLHSIITINDAKDTRCALDEFRAFSKSSGIKLCVLENPAELEVIINQDEPDMCIVVGWYWMLTENILEKVPNGFVGIHASMLPRYRGGSPLVWQILNGERQGGLSLFYLNKDMDTGDIVDQTEFNIHGENTIAEILEKAEFVTGKLLEKNYPLLLKGRAPRIPQDHTEAKYFPQRTPEDGEIHWNATNVEIQNTIRAQTHPYPGAFSYVRGKKLHIWKSQICSRHYSQTPGQIVNVSDNSIIITCGKGALHLYEVQFEGCQKEAANIVLKYGEKMEGKKTMRISSDTKQ